ncbi:hypothetical protein NAV28_09025 [Pseudomonas stutzeri]|nr:hypothetical protein [Stutzerimonas degradans]
MWLARLREYGFLAAGVVGVFAVATFFVCALQAGQTGAAWVQAVGSLIAILVAIQVARNDRKDAIARETRKEGALFAAIHRKGGAAHFRLDALNSQMAVCIQDLEDVDSLIPYIENVDASRSELDSFDLSRMPSAEAVEALVGIISALQGAKYQASRLIAGEEVIDHERGPLFHHLVVVSDHLRFFKRPT